MPDQEKIIDKIRKLYSLAESEEAIGNSGAAENIGAKAQELLLKYKLSHADIKLVQETEPDFIPPIMGKSIVPNPFLRANAAKKVRILWFEELAKVVAEAYFCKARVEQGDVWFYGLDMDREVAIYMFGEIAKRANAVHDQEFAKLKKVVGAARISIGRKSEKEPLPRIWEGDKAFTDSFHKGFRDALKEKFAENINGDNETFQKSMKDVEDYVSNNSYESGYSYYGSSYGYSMLPEERANWLYVINRGKEYGSRVSSKVSSISQQSTNEKLILTEKKGYVGEVYAVLDDSGSMSWPEGKLSQLKDGIRSFASEANAKGQAVGLIKFGDEAIHLIKPQLEVDKGFISVVNKLDASSGGTEMGNALKVAQSYFRNTRVKKTILLMTDGQPTDLGGKEKVVEIANEIKRTGIEIITIGCGNADEEFLKRIATDANKGELVADNDLKNGMKRMAGLLSA